MNPVNKVLSLFSLRLSRANKTISDKEKEFREKYDHYYKLAENNKRGFKAFKNYVDYGGR